MTQTTNNNQKWVLVSPADPAFEPDHFGLGVLYFDTLKKHGNRIAQIDSDTGESQTYEEVLLKSICVAQEMVARGIKPNDVISLCTYNHMYSYTPILAATYLLVKVASLDPTLSIDDMRYMLNLTKPRMIFCVPESVESIEIALEQCGLRCNIVVFGETKKHIPFNGFLLERGNENCFKPKSAVDIFDTAFVFFSSGTTGLPKGICLHHYGLIYISNFFKDGFHFNMTLNFTSSYWISHVICYTTTVLSGGCRLISKNFEGDKVLEMIQNFKVTSVFIAPAFTYSITSNRMCGKYNTSSVKTFMTGGSTIAVSQIQALEKLFPFADVIVGYGLTEISGIFCCFNPYADRNLIKSKRNSSGKMLLGHSCKVVDLDTDQILGPNEPGELLIKSKCLMNGYYNNPDGTKLCYDKDGFFRTGDIVYYDEEQCFYVIDRIKEMFKYRSWHILPAELENIILTHPAIKEAIIIGYPHEEDGDHPMAIVILKDNVSITEIDIMDFFNGKVSDRKKLRGGVKFVKSLPRTSTGKYNRRSLRNMIINCKI